ncbi:STAS domain-containing protein [Pseudomonas bharatica]|uniref:STAS domain-containing protein n=1 Tax=Pseudomonas bharatica TaxID=2692112 RepID=UPI003B28C57D
MSLGSVQLAEPDVLSLAGILDYRSGPDLRKQGAALIASSKAEALVLDCTAVQQSSSVGLSLLLGFIRDAQAAGKHCAVRGMPHGMREIAEVYGLDDILALQ